MIFFVLKLVLEVEGHKCKHMHTCFQLRSVLFKKNRRRKGLRAVARFRRLKIKLHTRMIHQIKGMNLM